MATLSRNAPTHRRVGAALGYHRPVIGAVLRCGSCGSKEESEIDGDVHAKDALADVSCMWCGRLGRMTVAQINGRRSA